MVPQTPARHNFFPQVCGTFVLFHLSPVIIIVINVEIVIIGIFMITITVIIRIAVLKKGGILLWAPAVIELLV